MAERARSRRYTVTVRTKAKVRKEHYEQLAVALDALEMAGRELENGAAANPAGGTLIRRIEPGQQVVGRIELAGPGRLRGGVDVRGDGSSEAFHGRLSRRLIEQRRSESPYDALRRALGP